MQFIADLDWHTLRLGAFHILAQVGERSIDTREALLNRFEDVLFHKIYRDDPAFPKFLDYVDEDAFGRVDERAGDVRPNPAAELMPTESKTPWFHTVELWQSDRRLPAPGVGPIAVDHAARFLDLGKKLGIFTPTNALSERGEILRAFFARTHGLIDSALPIPNPLLIDTLASRVILLEALLREDALMVLMLMEFTGDPEAGIARAFRKVGGIPQPELLMRAAQHLYDILGVEPDIYTALELQHLRKYIDNLAEKKNHLNQALPRMEFAVDLDVIQRAGVGRRTREPVYRPTENTRRFVEAFGRFRTDPTAAQNDLDDTFFRGMAATYGIPAHPVESDDERLLWFCRGYKLIKRPAGFTPGRSAAFAGALLALEQSRLVDLSEMFSAVYRAAHGPWSQRLGFSGGSRFDREFLIRVDERLEDELRIASPTLPN
jgi:hypothetical protein